MATGIAALAAPDASARMELAAGLIGMDPEGALSLASLRQLVGPFARLRGGGPGEANGIARTVLAAAMASGPTLGGAALVPLSVTDWMIEQLGCRSRVVYW